MARRLAGRFGYPEQPHHFDVTIHEDKLWTPARWRKPRTVFVCSMSDIGHPSIPNTIVNHCTRYMALAHSEHTWIVLTKRPRRLLELWADIIPLDNLWLGTSVENQQAADERWDDFEQTPAVVKFVSYEPALGPIDWTGWEFVDLIISGGESGPGARPSHPDWHRITRDFCQENSIAYFFKQWGAFRPTEPGDAVDHAFPYDWHSDKLPVTMSRVGKHRAGRLLDGKEWNEWPK